MLPIMAVSTKPGVIESYAVELRRLLGRINADVSNDAFSTADLLKECRHEFFRALMDGRATSEEDVLRHLRLIRSKMDPTKPCVVAELERLSARPLAVRQRPAGSGAAQHFRR